MGNFTLVSSKRNCHGNLTSFRHSYVVAVLWYVLFFCSVIHQSANWHLNLFLKWSTGYQSLSLGCLLWWRVLRFSLKRHLVCTWPKREPLCFLHVMTKRGPLVCTCWPKGAPLVCTWWPKGAPLVCTWRPKRKPVCLHMMTKGGTLSLHMMTITLFFWG